MRSIAETPSSRRDIKTRQHLMERSFARSIRYGYKKSRWRRLWRNQIQEYLTAAIQNIEVLIRHGNKPKKSAVMAVLAEKTEKKVFTQVLLIMEHLLKVPIKAIPYYSRGVNWRHLITEAVVRKTGSGNSPYWKATESTLLFADIKQSFIHRSKLYSHAVLYNTYYTWLRLLCPCYNTFCIKTALIDKNS